MSRQLVGFFIILFISGLTANDVEDLSATGLLKELYAWAMKIYGTVQNLKNPDKSKENIEKVMTQINEISTKIDSLESHLDIKLDAMLNTLLVDINLENNLNGLKTIFRQSVFKINNYFVDSRQYTIGGAFGNDTVKEFAHKVLWSTDGVPDLLDDLNDVFFADGAQTDGFLSVMLQRTILNILHDCDTNVSSQQMVYYIYIQVFITEVKALITQHRTFLIQRYFDASSYDYTSESNRAMTKYRERLRRYNILFTEVISRFPQHLRRCEAKSPTRGVNFIELQRFSRIIILNRDVVFNDQCIACPKESTLRDFSRRTNSTVNNCRSMGTSITTCPAKSGSPHEYLWWRAEDGSQYGPKTRCDNERKIAAGSISFPGYRGSPTQFFYCVICACLAETNEFQSDASTIWRVSVTPQYSDFYNNKIVTGVKFVLKDNALHLQIQQAAFSYSGMATGPGEWKDLDIGFHDTGIRHTKAPMHFEPLRSDRKTFYLDDIKAPDGYAVTGLRFKLVDNSAFKLELHVCEFDFNIGEVFPFGCRWIDASSNPMNPDDYKEKRSEIDMGQSDDPTRASQFQYDLHSNKQIKFTHSDINKDAGQTTIPLIDSQSVEGHPPFPLGGIGISFRGRKDYAGYIAPRIFTFNVTCSMEFPIDNSNG